MGNIPSEFQEQRVESTTSNDSNNSLDKIVTVDQLETPSTPDVVNTTLMLNTTVIPDEVSTTVIPDEVSTIVMPHKVNTIVIPDDDEVNLTVVPDVSLPDELNTPSHDLTITTDEVNTTFTLTDDLHTQTLYNDKIKLPTNNCCAIL